MDENSNFKTNWKSIWIANLVAFITSVASGSISPIVWPYLKQIDVSVNETLFGFVRGGNFLVLMAVSLISGYIVNKSGNVKLLLILSKVLFTASATFFYLMGIIPKAYVYFFIASELLSGFAGGVGSVFRIYVAMASTEADRGKACGIMQLSAAAGIILGPALQLGFSQIPYPGVKLFWVFYINLFTAPIFLAIFTAIVGIILFTFCFDGRIWRQTLTNFQDSAPIKKIKKVSVNKIAIIILILTKMILELVNVTFSTIAPMYAMAAFQLTSTDAVKLQSLMTALIGLLSVAICFGYVYFKLNSRIPERIPIVLGIAGFFCFYLVTYPWGFYNNSIGYLHKKGQPAIFNLEVAKNDSDLQNLIEESKLPNSTIQLVGCNLELTWCQTTSQVNFYLFIVATIIAMGILNPFVAINLDILYSKVLGPIKQGVWQSVFLIGSQIVDVAGALVFTKIYVDYGPKPLWIIGVSVSAANCLLLLLCYQFLKPWKPKSKTKSRVKMIKIVKNIAKFWNH